MLKRRFVAGSFRGGGSGLLGARRALVRRRRIGGQRWGETCRGGWAPDRGCRLTSGGRCNRSKREEGDNHRDEAMRSGLLSRTDTCRVRTPCHDSLIATRCRPGAQEAYTSTSSATGCSAGTRSRHSPGLPSSYLPPHRRRRNPMPQSELPLASLRGAEIESFIDQEAVALEDQNLDHRGGGAGASLFPHRHDPTIRKEANLVTRTAVCFSAGTACTASVAGARPGSDAMRHRSRTRRRPDRCQH